MRARSDRSDLQARLTAAGLEWIVPDWPAAMGVHGLMTTRRGGIALGPRSSLDLGGADAPDDAVRVNRARLRAFLPEDPHWLHQVHGTRVITIGAATSPAPPAWPEADAAVTATPGAVCVVRVADCLPVLIADARGRCVGVAHAGWRGLAAGVVEATVEALRALGSRDEVAWLGPAIGPAAFEVGPEVRDAFLAREATAAAAFVAGAPGKWHADLYTLGRLALARAGVRTVTGGGWCTRTDAARFFSYRRDHGSGRMAACAWIEPACGASV
ncbi:MAG: peptidoglycan editing factor PgeF [Casimicrobiaceae bacterium]